MVNKFQNLTITLFCSILLIACGGGSGNGSPSVSELAGEWQFTLPDEGDGEDIIFYEIKNDGQFVQYDFHGDDFNLDTGLFCNTTDEIFSIEESSESIFVITYEDGSKQLVDSYEVTDTSLSLSGTDSFGNPFNTTLNLASEDLSTIPACSTLLGLCLESANQITLEDGESCKFSDSTISTNNLDTFDEDGVNFDLNRVISCNSGYLYTNGITYGANNNQFYFNTLTINCM